MRKITLDVDQLKVDSFQTDGVQAGRGTVHGHYFTEVGCYTDEAHNCGSVGGTCEQSCYGSCNSACNSCYGSCNCSGDTCNATCPLPETCAYNIC